MSKRSLIPADFETEAIQRRPEYPPKPVGLAIKLPGEPERYMAWGHPEGNNCTKADAKRVLSTARKDGDIVYHNSGFDTDVAQCSMGLKTRAHTFHDTMFLAFLDNPRGHLSLKSLAHDHLGMPPDEQTNLRNWILEHVKEATPRTWGAYIAKAPVRLVAPYAEGDVKRTLGLFKELYPSVVSRGMEDAYRRELALVPIVTEMETRGIRIDVERLEQDIVRWREYLEIVDARIRNILDAPFSMNPGSGTQLAEWLVKRKLARWPAKQTEENRHLFTAKGQRSTKYDVLLEVCVNKDVATLIRMRNMLSTSISTFAENWLRQARASGGYVLPQFNQVRSQDDRNDALHGTRTGRFSSERPNFQNITNPYDAKDPDAAELLVAMQRLIPGFNPPNLRDYVVPDPGHVLLNRDYDQQELRILAHYEDGVLLSRYRENPDTDSHELVRQLVNEAVGVLYPRKHIKITNFGIIYGMGVAKLAKRLGISPAEAKKLRGSVLKAIPGIRTLSKELTSMGRRGEFIRTWGGRLYNSESPKNGRRFEYKLLNVLIQGGAADCTKEAMINCDLAMENAKLTLQVHDELMAQAPADSWQTEMKLMKEAMEDVNFDLPMLTDGKMSAESWFRMKETKI